MAARIFRFPQVREATGLSRSTIYRLIRGGLWPQPVRVGKQAVGWPESEVEAINRARIAGEDDGAIKDLVSRLKAERMARHDG